MSGYEVIKRSSLTAQVIAALNGSILVGRGTAPPEGGFPQGTPGSQDFIPYLVVKTGIATTPSPGEPENLRRYRTSWIVMYSFTYHSTSDSRVDDFADVGRDLVLSVLPETYVLDGVTWRLQTVQIPRMGATEKDDSTDPAHWRLTDDVSLRLSRENAG